MCEKRNPPIAFSLVTPARVHFGLFSVSGSRQFGGMGLMVNQPASVIKCRQHSHFASVGSHCELVEKIAEDWFESFGHLTKELVDHHSIPFEISLTQSAPRHSGLGTGTQIAFAVSTTLFHALGIAFPSITASAQALQRGRRSAIGSYGFFHGGCLVDDGVADDETFAALDERIEFPNHWPIVLICPGTKAGLHGQFEISAFEQLRSSERNNRKRLVDLCQQEIVPALRQFNYDAFAEPLHKFNRISGEYFSKFQNGPYNGSSCARIVQAVRSFGVKAVGQSSWGPCIFAIARNDEQANDLVTFLRSSCPEVGNRGRSEIIVTYANNQGYSIQDNVNKSISVT